LGNTGDEENQEVGLISDETEFRKGRQVFWSAMESAELRDLQEILWAARDAGYADPESIFVVT
jgi:hypothetical protein